MSTGIYSIGVSGIAAAQLGLLATEHNVVNANTPGYTRQRTVQATNIAVNTGAGAIGQGVHVETIERMYDQYLTGQVNSATSTLSEIDSYYTEIKQIDNLLADPSAGLTPALQDFFSGVQGVASNPALLSARQAMISSAETLTARFQSLDSRLDDLTNEVNGKITDATSAINAYASQIADLNQRIVVAQGSYGQPPNDLLDQRDQLINELNGLIKVSTSTNSDGTFNVFIGSGQQLVVGPLAMNLTARASMADPTKMVVGLATPGGGSLELPEKLVIGGELGGLVQFRSETLGRVQNELGRLAASVALTFNAQHALGQDLLGHNGTTVESFFSMSSAGPSVISSSANVAPATVTAAFLSPSYGPEVSAGNFYTNLTTSDYRLSYTSSGYSLTRLDDNAAITLTATATPGVYSTADGFSITVAGADTVGNTYLIQPTKNAAANIAVNQVVAADSRLIAAAAPFKTAAVSANTGTGTISTGTMVGGTASGFGAGSLPVTVTYNSVAGTLAFSGAGAPANVVVKTPGGGEASVATAGGVAYQSGMTISFSGMSFTLSGSLNNNDQFTLTANTGGTADGRNALSMGLLQTANTVAGNGTQGKATFQAAYAQVVANNGIKTRELKVTGEAQQAVLDQAKANRDALSGVNLDEEAANMLRFQQAYQASAKLLEVGKTLFDTLIQIG